MKIVNKMMIVVLLLTVCLAASALAGRGARKLPVNSYISAAKIEIIGFGESQGRDLQRIELAQALLDSLFLNYGPHPEGYYWMNQIQVDLAANTSDLKDKLVHVQKVVAYADSLRWACDNDDVKKKYRKKCKAEKAEVDSTSVLLWREFFNAGVGQIDQIEETQAALAAETDSIARIYYDEQLAALIDSSQDNMVLAMTIDSTDPRPLMGLATVQEKLDDIPAAVKYLEQALPIADDRNQILTQIAYDYVQIEDYAQAIPWLREFVDSATIDEQIMQDETNRAAVLSTMGNLSICYNNIKQYDSAYTNFMRILTFEPENVAALTGGGRYQNQLARMASDSARSYQEAGDTVTMEHWRDIKSTRFDSARVFLKQTFELKADDPLAAEEYAVTAAIGGNFEEAVIGFARAAELEPTNSDHWTSLGDCNLNLHKFAEAAAAYEKVGELEPTNEGVWENLKDLYFELGNDARRAEVIKIIEAL